MFPFTLCILRESCARKSSEFYVLALEHHLFAATEKDFGMDVVF